MEHGKSLFKIINGLRYFGVGTKLKRVIHKFPETYYIVTRVNLSPDQKHGKVWGRLVWRGKAGEEELIRSPLKKQWSLLNLPNYSTFNGTVDEVNNMLPKDSIETKA